MITLSFNDTLHAESSHRAATTKALLLNGENKTPPPGSKKRRPAAFVPVLAVLAVIAWISWHFLGQANFAAPHDTAAAPAPVMVGVQTVTARTLRLWNNFSGRLRAVDSTEIRPEVSGRITEARFQNGQSVKAGDILMVIDPRIYEAAVARAQARIDGLINAHFKGVYFLTQALLPLLADGGRIVNLSTGLTRMSYPGFAAYAAAKGAVEVLTVYLAKETGYPPDHGQHGGAGCD